ncbi:hypothetical protein ACEPAG_9169 [Sanghuangporus baumii]
MAHRMVSFVRSPQTASKIWLYGTLILVIQPEPSRKKASSKHAYVDLISRTPKNVLTLDHETYNSTAYDVIPYAIDQFKSKGYEFLSVSECLGSLSEGSLSEGHHEEREEREFQLP